MYEDRIEAGFVLAEQLEKYRNQDAVILTIPRGGVPVAYPIARQLGFPVDLLLIKKLGHPTQPEYAIGAVSLSDVVVARDEYVDPSYIEEATREIRERLKEMYQKFRGNRQPENLTGRIVIIVDDGIATGRTLLSGINFIKKNNPAKIVIAVPVAARGSLELLAPMVDEIICPLVPDRFFGVGGFYLDFSQTTDEEVVDYLSKLSNDQAA
ncbi:phosphoribosyltransferase [Polluticoccus soli]|uniref:phosphoribosyltransferase n=1 Tax=Polluticoccus soli TaxID=3034150 RepID=UPI0023E1BD1F|nr:phosphoribosyltransferase family protein [Flavipsychrobacter sp. JY13-12]